MIGELFLLLMQHISAGEAGSLSSVGISLADGICRDIGYKAPTLAALAGSWGRQRGHAGPFIIPWGGGETGCT